MPAKIIDGSAIAKCMLEEAREAAAALEKRPKLAVILVGGDPGSKIYVQKKQQACEQAGIVSEVFHFPDAVPERELLERVRKLNADKSVSGILLQLPLPPNLGRNRLLEAIDPRKDVDGFTPKNIGRLALGIEGMVSCTPMGIIKLIESTGAELRGKNCCIISHSIVVGKPLAQLLLNRDATVTVCHKYTKNLSEFTKKADILITAAGVPGLITAGMVKKGAVVIDAGIAKKGGKTAGDVDFEKVSAVAGFITPVPGGVGPMTVACLMHNTVNAALLQRR